MTFARVFGLLAALALSSCTIDTPDNTGGDAKDTAQPDEDTGAGFDLPDQPAPTMECTPTNGNVPLNVCCKISLGLDPDTANADYFLNVDWLDGTTNPALDPEKLDNVCHEFTYKGVFAPVLSVKWKKNVKVAGEATTSIEAIQPSALGVGNVQLHSAELLATGDPVVLGFTISNEGDEVTAAFKTGVFLSVDDKVDDTDLMIYEIVHEKGIGSGLQEPVIITYSKEKPIKFDLPAKSLSGKAIPDGDYFVIVKVDHEDKVGELNKLDNERFAGSLLEIDNTVYLQSDVTVTPPEVDTTITYSPGESASYKLSVENKGPGEAKNFKLAVYLSKDKVIQFKPDIANEDVNINQSDLLITDPATATFPTLQAGGKLPIQRTFGSPDIPDGKYYIIAKIDVTDTLVEADETNNIAVSAQPLEIKKVIKKGIDVALLEMSVTPKGTYLDGTVSVNYHLKNVGTQPSPKMDAVIYFCKGALSKSQCLVNKTSFDVPALAVGQELKQLEIVSINKSTPVGEYNVYLLVDPDSKVPELDEGNNIKKFPSEKDDSKLVITSTKSVDLTVKSIGFHPATLDAGEELKLGYKVINGGTSGTGAFKVFIVASADNNITKASIQQGTDYVIATVIDPGVGSLGTEFRVNKVVVPKGLSHKINEWYIGVFVDAEDDINGETDENNNLGKASEKLIVNKTQGGCYEDKFDVDDKTHNNSKDKAVALPTGASTAFASCGDDDWYTIDVSKGHSVFVTLQAAPILWTSPVGSDLDIEIVSPEGKVLTSVKGLGTFKKATALTVAAAGKYFLRVFPHTSSVQAHYTLDVKIEAPPSGVDLFAGSLTAGPTGVFLGALLKTKLQLTNLGNNPSSKFDVDYRLSTDPKFDKTDVKLLTHTFDKGLGGAEGFTLHKNVLLPDNVKGGKYYIVAHVDAADAINEKDEKNNTVSSNSVAINANKKCASDAYAGNHTPADAAKLEAKTQEIKDLNVCPGLEDWFQLDLPQGKAITIELVWKHESPKGIVGVQFVDDSATGVIAGAANPFDSIAKIPYLQIGGKYYLHTYVLPEFGGSPEPRDYGLKVTISEPDPSDVCLPDVYEQNNSQAAAKEVGCGLANLTLCVGDEDWFFLDLAKDEEIKFIFTQAGGSFQFNIYDNPKLKPISTTSGSNEVAFKAPKAGKFYMQVTYAQGASKPSDFAYKLKVDGGKGVDIIPEIQSIYPTKAAEDESVSLETVVSNECKTPAGDFHVGYYLSADNLLDSGDILLTERPIAGLKGKTKATVFDSVIIPFGWKIGKANVIVKVDNREVVTESQELNNIALEAVDVVAGCKPDKYEFNDDLSQAVAVTQRRLEDLTICPFDKDVWQFDVKQGETLTVTVEFKHSDGNLDLRLYEKGKIGPIAKSVNNSDPEQISITASADTTYYARVRGAANDAWNHYTLLSCIAVGSKCVECQDKSECSGEDVCKDTKCQPLGCTVGVAKTCDDGNSCTTGQCIADEGCKFEQLVGSECEDGDPCTMGNTCDAKGTCVASLSQAVTQTLWSDTGAGGDMVLIPANAERLYIGSRIDPVDGKLKGRAELIGGGGGVPFWKQNYWHSKGSAQHLASAVTRTGGDELLAVGWVEMAAPATVALAGAATETAGWIVQIAGSNGAMMGSKLIGDGGAKRAALRRIVELKDGTYAVVGWATGKAAADGHDAFAAVVDGKGNTATEVLWGGAGADAFYDVAADGGGGFVTAGVNRDDKGKGVGVLVGFDAKHAKVWDAPLAIGSFDTALWSLTHGLDGGWVAGGGADVGQGGGTPPNYKGWVVWLSAGKAGTAPLMAGNVVLDPTTPQDPDFKGTKIAMVMDVHVRADGSALAAGTVGARSGAKGLTDAAVWVVGADRKLLKTYVWGGPQNDSFEAVAWWQGQLRGFGSQGVSTTAPKWYDVRDTPTKTDCDDGNACTVDACNAKDGCTHTAVANGTACGTGLACNAGQCAAK